MILPMSVTLRTRGKYLRGCHSIKALNELGMFLLQGKLLLVLNPHIDKFVLRADKYHLPA